MAVTWNVGVNNEGATGSDGGSQIGRAFWGVALSFLSRSFNEPDRFPPIQDFHERFVSVLVKDRLFRSSSGVFRLRLAEPLEEPEECDEGSELAELRWGVENDDEEGLCIGGVAACCDSVVGVVNEDDERKGMAMALRGPFVWWDPCL